MVVGVKVVAHVAEAVVPDRVHVVNVPVTPVTDIATVPVGVMNAPGEVSVTVTLHVDPVFTFTEAGQATVVVVVRGVTVTLAVPVLPLWFVSPG